MEFKFIVNPKTGKKVSVISPFGKQILNNYILKKIKIGFTFLHVVKEKNLKLRLSKRKILNRYDKFSFKFYKKVQNGFINQSKTN